MYIARERKKQEEEKRKREEAKKEKQELKRRRREEREKQLAEESAKELTDTVQTETSMCSMCLILECSGGVMHMHLTCESNLGTSIEGSDDQSESVKHTSSCGICCCKFPFHSSLLYSKAIFLPFRLSVYNTGSTVAVLVHIL